jgi:hypothetical protein
MKCDQNTSDCQVAVTRTFEELRQRNMPYLLAIESAVTVFRYHHPEIPEAEAKKTVDKWLID